MPCSPLMNCSCITTPHCSEPCATACAQRDPVYWKKLQLVREREVIGFRVCPAVAQCLHACEEVSRCDPGELAEIANEMRLVVVPTRGRKLSPIRNIRVPRLCNH